MQWKELIGKTCSIRYKELDTCVSCGIWKTNKYGLIIVNYYLILSRIKYSINKWKKCFHRSRDICIARVRSGKLLRTFFLILICDWLTYLNHRGSRFRTTDSASGITDVSPTCSEATSKGKPEFGGNAFRLHRKLDCTECEIF